MPDQTGPNRDPPAEGGAGGTTSLSLLDRARAADPAAWDRVVRLYQPLVLAWCSRAGVRGADADDVAQDVFASAFNHLDRFRRDRPGDTFRGWLRAVTRNQLLMHFRRNQGRARGEGGSGAWADLQAVADPLAGQPEDADEADGLYRRAVEQVRGDFEEQTWQAFWLTVVEGRSAAALAADLGMTTVAVRQAKFRVLRRLKEELGELLD